MDLSQIRGPEDLRGLTEKEMDALAGKLRARIIEVVSKNGGHLASNLGVVELTLALHRVFDSPKDKIVFDVGHQCYVHKMLTGRNELMDSLRQYGGVSGFPKISESEHDAYGTGHASTALSAALGMARARDLNKGQEHIIAVVGDGALTGGLCFEALNNLGQNKTRLIVILNDNQMSIAPNVGALSNYLTRMRTSKAWLELKHRLSDFFLKVPLIGKGLYNFLQRVKDSVRNFFIKDHYFDSLGLRYLGPIDGHNERYLEKILERAKRFEEPVLIHVVTQKGRGYKRAENDPSTTHGVNPFDPENGEPTGRSKERSFGKAAGELLVELGREDKRIVAISAAMVDATGLSGFGKAYPDRLFDVGIAEAHAVTLAAGLAAYGMRPVVALYDTFLQRAYDQVVADVCVQNLPVTFLIDRAGMGGADGPTHHGVFGAAFLRHVPGLMVFNPRSLEEMQAMLRFALSHEGPVFIRYPRSEHALMQTIPYQDFVLGRWERMNEPGEIALLATGTMVPEALIARDILKEKGILAQVVNAATIKPMDTGILHELSLAGTPYYILEEQALAGGLGSAVSEYCVQEGLKLPERIFAVPDRFISHGSHQELLKDCGLDGESIAAALMKEREKNA